MPKRDLELVPGLVRAQPNCISAQRMYLVDTPLP